MNKEQILKELLQKLWHQYVSRVSYAAKYAEIVKQKGGQVANDHIAYRTLNTKTGTQPAGVVAIARIFESFGYIKKEKYEFPAKKLTAWHWEHEKNEDNPKIFISQLELSKLDENTRKLINEAVAHAPDPLTSTDLELLEALKAGENLDKESAHALIESLVDFFGRHWPTPKRKIVVEVNKSSQYAAWTLLHGNSVNHFTAYINKQGVKDWKNIKDTVDALRASGVPMKREFEGEFGSKLCQSSTEAVMEKCDVIEDDGKAGKIDWSYAYYEIAERGLIKDKDGKEKMFHGFLGEQATNLFEMTKTN